MSIIESPNHQARYASRRTSKTREATYEIESKGDAGIEYLGEEHDEGGKFKIGKRDRVVLTDGSVVPLSTTSDLHAHYH